ISSLPTYLQAHSFDFGADECEGHNALKSSGTSPNFRNTVASRKSPVAGSPLRLNATAPVWPNTFQRPCARSIAVAGLGHSIGSPTTTLPSATSNGNATKYVIPVMVTYSIIPVLTVGRHGFKTSTRIAVRNGGL